ncbi:MAG: hypothetical protein QXT05_01020 [Candidatus Bilamarchaeaceae archaeon]
MNLNECISDFIKKNFGLTLVLTTLAIYLILKGFLVGKQYGWVDIFFGAVILIEIASTVFLEIKEGAEKHGWKHEIIDTVLALAIGLAIWITAQFLLNTSTPISGVVSCSMLNDLQRGDFVIVQGGDIKAPEVELTESEYRAMLGGPFHVSSGETNTTVNFPFHTYCTCHPTDSRCVAFYNTDTEFVESVGPAIYHYKWCTVNHTRERISRKIRCLDYVEIKGKRFAMADKNNDVIVYTPRQTDLYARVGDIVHRTVARLRVGNNTYYLTGGDNNPVLDAQVYECSTGIGNQPVPASNIKGKVIARIPYLGYLKLFIAGYWKEDQQCSWTLER